MSPEIEILSLFDLLTCVPCIALDGKITISSCSTLISTLGALNKFTSFMTPAFFNVGLVNKLGTISFG